MEALLPWLKTLGLIAGTILVYELLRASVLRRLMLRMQRSASGYLARHRVHLDRFKFVQKHYIREALMNDRVLAEFMLEQSRADGTPIEELRHRTETYIEEIVPFFNLVSYYKLGFGIARPLMGALYDVAYSPENLRAAWSGSEDKDATVFVINHRSNADYVLFALCMSRQVALSYAVGEWARVWPLESLFKSFGSYFVRRGERDPLYHQVLRRYIQTVTIGGLAQGFFIEGKLTRTGAMNPPKLGLLDNLIGVFEHGFEGDIRFVPVGLNFDRVLEDDRLLAENRGKPVKPRLRDKLRSAVALLRTLPPVVAGRGTRVLRGAWRYARRGHLGFGVAAVHAGPGLGMREFFGDRLDDVLKMDRHDRKAELLAFGEELTRRIAVRVPVTAVPVYCAALERIGCLDGAAVTVDALTTEIREMLTSLRGNGAPIMLGESFGDLDAERAAATSGAAGAPRGLLGLEEDLIGADEAAALRRFAAGVLSRRGALIDDGVTIRAVPGREELVRYYALSIADHTAKLEKPAGTSAVGSASHSG